MCRHPNHEGQWEERTAAGEGSNSEEENHTVKGRLEESKGCWDAEDWPLGVEGPLCSTDGKKLRLW